MEMKDSASIANATILKSFSKARQLTCALVSQHFVTVDQIYPKADFSSLISYWLPVISVARYPRLISLMLFYTNYTRAICIRFAGFNVHDERSKR